MDWPRRAIDVGRPAPEKVSGTFFEIHQKRCLTPFRFFVEMFGLYGLAGRVASWAGLSAVWAVTWATGSFRLGMVTILVFLFAGLWLLCGVRQEEKESDG